METFNFHDTKLFFLFSSLARLLMAAGMVRRRVRGGGLTAAKKSNEILLSANNLFRHPYTKALSNDAKRSTVFTYINT
jgi:hypothetical protein